MSPVVIFLSALLLSAQDKKPNILFVLSDDHSAAFLGSYGNAEIRTPTLDRFAEQGVRFERAYVACPQCVPSRAALMTGRSPVATAMTRFSAPLPADIPAAPDLLKAAGYYTGILGRSFHLDGSGNQPPETSEVFDRYDLRTFERRVDFLNRNANRTQIPALIEDFFDKAPKGRPYFLWVGFSDPHRILDRNAISEPHDPGKLKLPPFFPDTRLLREDLGRYYDEVARLDGDFGKVLQILEERGRAQNTLIIFMGDNGAALLRGKGTLYELGIRVPLIARWSGRVARGQIRSELISGEDITPTLLEAAGLPVPREMTGRSFLKLLLGDPTYEPRRYVFAERGAHGSSLPRNTAAFDLGRVIVGRSHKLIYNALWQLPYHPVDFANDPFWKEIQELNREGKLAPELARIYFPPERPMFELYDLDSDPYEMVNLAEKSEYAAIERELKAALQEWMILERDHLPLPVPPR